MDTPTLSVSADADAPVMLLTGDIARFNDETRDKYTKGLSYPVFHYRPFMSILTDCEVQGRKLEKEPTPSSLKATKRLQEDL